VNVQTTVENHLISPVIEDNAAFTTTLSFPPMFGLGSVKTNPRKAKEMSDDVKTEWLTKNVTVKGVATKASYREDGASVIPYMMPSGVIRFTAVRSNGGCLVTDRGDVKRFATLVAAQKALA